VSVRFSNPFLKGFIMNELACRLRDAILLVDSAVLPGKQLPLIVFDCRPNPGHPQFGFVRDLSGAGRDSYWVYSQGIDEYFEEGRMRHLKSIELANTHNILAKLEPNDFCLQEMVPYDEGEAILASAFHEVRHRIQFQPGVVLFNDGHTNQVERCRLWGQLQARHYKNEPNGELEFDAKFFECYGVLELRQGCLNTDAEQLRNFLSMTP